MAKSYGRKSQRQNYYKSMGHCLVRNLHRKFVLGYNTIILNPDNTISLASCLPQLLRSGAWIPTKVDKCVFLNKPWSCVYQRWLTPEPYWGLSKIIMFGSHSMRFWYNWDFKSSLCDSHVQPRLRISSLHKYINQSSHLCLWFLIKTSST